jgi:hypothetical protein
MITFILLLTTLILLVIGTTASVYYAVQRRSNPLGLLAFILLIIALNVGNSTIQIAAQIDNLKLPAK